MLALFDEVKRFISSFSSSSSALKVLDLTRENKNETFIIQESVFASIQIFSQRASMGSSLPFDLILEILQRTPAESLLRFKSTCKKWYELISNDKRFMYKHLDKSTKRFLRIENRERVQILDPVTEILAVSTIPNELRHKYFTLIHCDGLMLGMCYEELGSDPNLAVWNPVMRKIKWIKPSPPLVCYWGSDYLGFGYDKTFRDNYKILRFTYLGDDDDDESYPKCQIYEFNSGSWRSIEAKFDGEIDVEVDGVSVNGSMYWIELQEKKNFILSFDFSKETFNRICDSPLYWDIKRLGCFNGDRLSLLQQNEATREIHVSVTNKLSDEVVSFSRYFSVTLPDIPLFRSIDILPLPGCFIGKNRNIIAWCEQLVGKYDDHTSIILYEIGEGGVTKRIRTGRHEADEDYNDLDNCSYVYVPSLIPVPE